MFFFFFCPDTRWWSHLVHLFPSVLTMHFVGTEEWLCPPFDPATPPFTSYCTGQVLIHSLTLLPGMLPSLTPGSNSGVSLCVVCRHTHHKYVHADKCLPFKQTYLLSLAWSGCFLSDDSERFWPLFTQHSCNFHTTCKCVYTHTDCGGMPVGAAAETERGCTLFPFK